MAASWLLYMQKKRLISLRTSNFQSLLVLMHWKQLSGKHCRLGGASVCNRQMTVIVVNSVFLEDEARDMAKCVGVCCKWKRKDGREGSEQRHNGGQDNVSELRPHFQLSFDYCAHHSSSAHRGRGKRRQSWKTRGREGSYLTRTRHQQPETSWPSVTTF